MKRILIVDDDVMLLKKMEELVRSILEELGRETVDILTARSGAEALGIISHTEIQMLLTDYSMPDLSGLDLIAELKERPEMKKVLVTFSPIHLTEMRQKGADEVLLKPVDDVRLREVLDRFLWPLHSV